MDPKEVSNLTNKPIRLDDSRILTIPDKDNGEKLVGILDLPRVVLPSQVKTKVKGVNDSPNIVVREDVRRRLEKAIKLLPKNYGFVLIEGLRSYKYQKKLFEEQLKKQATQFVSDPDVYSPHLTGGALDIAIYNLETNDYLDMGNLFEKTDSAMTNFPDLTEEQKNNRNLLIKIMQEVGFVNYAGEWWHWSFGDKLWAFLNNKENSIYGNIK